MTNPPNATPGLITWIAASRPRSSLVLLIAGVAVAVIPAVLYARYGADMLGVEITTGLMALILLMAGVGQRIWSAGGDSPVDAARMLVLTVGGLIGLLLAATGVVLAYLWWDYLTRWLRFDEREGAWHNLVALAVLLAGLAVMFVSLQMARSEVRHSVGLRRLLYGYNTVLAGVLLFLILSVANVLAYTKLPNLVDSTESGIYRLSDRSVQIVRALDRPTTVYVIMSSRTPGYEELTTLLSNAQEYAPRLRVETLSPGLNADRIRDLAKKHSQVETSTGVLIVYGEGDKPQASFIRSDELVKSDGNPMGGGGGTESFEGEARLFTELSFLAGDRKKPIVYFASQNPARELDYNDSDPGKATGIGVLQRRLSQRNFDVRPLKFDAIDPKVPDDAAIVVIPGPRGEYTPKIVEALQKYLDEKKGKLLALLGTTLERGAETMPNTNLEGLLASFNVQVTKERVLTVPGFAVGGYAIRDAETTVAEVTEQAVRSQNPIATAFRGMPIRFLRARVVRPAPPQGGNPAFRADTLLATIDELAVWAETDLQVDPMKVIEEMGRNVQARGRLTSALPVAVLVSESGGPPSMGGPPPSAGKPRMAIFGDASFVINPLVDERRNEPNFDLFASTLEWLSERPSNIGIEPHIYKTFSLDPKVNSTRLLFLPALLAFVGIIGLGAGVWVVRRR